MMSFNTLLNEVGIEPASCKLVRHETTGPKGRTPYSIWINDPPSFDLYQSIQKRLVFNRDWLASFIGTPAHETLFVGLYRVSGPERNSVPVTCPVIGREFIPGTIWMYQLELDRRLANTEKRLIIEWGLGARSWTQNADAQPKSIIEFRREFREPAFPGYLKFHSRLNELRNAYITWQAALSAQRGVYLLVFDDGQQYVGSATGEYGFWQRWKDYLMSGDGGNVTLRGRDAGEAMISILETARLTDTREDILDSEYLWQRKLGAQTLRLGDA